MRGSHRLVVFALSLTLAAHADAAPGQTGKKPHSVHGVVTAIEKGQDKDAGTLTLKVHVKKGATAAAPEQEKKVKFTEATKFEFVSGKKGAQEVSAAQFADLKVGEHVTVLERDGVAAEVKIHKGKKK
jgi:hypothetical protein